MFKWALLGSALDFCCGINGNFFLKVHYNF